MAASDKRVVMIAMDGSSFADYAFECKYKFSSGMGEGGGGGGGGAGSNGGNFGTGVRASISKPTPFIYLAFEKTDPFIYLIIRNVDLFVGCPLIFLYPFIASSSTDTAVNSFYTKRTRAASKNLWAQNLCIYQDVRKVGPFT